MENSGANTQLSISSLATYQCVVCQTTYISLTELHRHQSYRHTPEELSLSTIGLHCSAIKMLESPNGIVYDNSWLHDPSRHAEFYTYSSNMLCDNINNNCIIDCTKKNQVMVGGLCIVDDQPNENIKKNEEIFINEKFVATINEPLLSIENFSEQESPICESMILDLTLKVSSDSLEKETAMQEDAMQDLSDHPIERLCDDFEKMTKVAAKRRSSSRKCLTPRKVSRVMRKKKLCIPKGKANTQVVEEGSGCTAELNEQNKNEADCIGQELTLESQDSLLHFVRKNRLPVVKNTKFGISQRKPLNLTKVVKKNREKRSTIVQISENQTNGKTVLVSRVPKFDLNHFLTYLKDQKKEIQDKPEENFMKQDAHKKEENVEEILPINSIKKKTGRDAAKFSSQDNKNENSPKKRSIFDPETSASCMDSKEVKFETQSLETIGKPIDTEKKTKHLKTVADNSINDRPPAVIQKCSNQENENEDSFKSCSISDPEEPASVLRIQRDKIDTVELSTKPPLKAEKSIATRKRAKIFDTVSDNADEEKTASKTQKYSKRCYKNRQLKFRSIFDTDESSTNFYALPADNGTKLISSRKQTKKSKTQANKSAKSQKLQKSFANENSEIKSELNHNTTVNSTNFSPAFEGDEMKFHKVSTVKSKKRVSAKKRAKNPKTSADKLPQRETFREINVPENQDYENDNFAKEKIEKALDVYSYTDDDSEDEVIATLSEFRARGSASFEKKWSGNNMVNMKCSQDNTNFKPVAGTLIGCSSNGEQIDARPLEETKQRTSSRKKAMDLKLASATSVVEEAGQEILKLYVEDGAYGNSVDQNSIAVPKANSHEDNVDEDATIESQREEINEKSNLSDIQMEDVETALNDPNTRSTQEIEALFHHLCDDENFGANNSYLVIEEYRFMQNESEAQTIHIPWEQNVEGVHDVTMNSAEAINNAESRQCMNAFSIDYCPKYSENKSSSRTSGVSFVAYPPGIDEFSALVLDPEIGHLVWKKIDLDASEVYDSQFDEMPNSGEMNNDNHPEVVNYENMIITQNVDSETSSISGSPAEINIFTSDGDSYSQNSNPTRRSTRTKKAVDRYVPQKK